MPVILNNKNMAISDSIPKQRYSKYSLWQRLSQIYFNESKHFSPLWIFFHPKKTKTKDIQGKNLDAT